MNFRCSNSIPKLKLRYKIVIFNLQPSAVQLFIIIFIQLGIELQFIAIIRALLDEFTLLQVSYLLEGNPDRMNFRVKDTGMTPLHAAVKSGSVATLKVISKSLGTDLDHGTPA